MNSFIPGQRWFSAAEPELGLGTVMRLAGRSVQIVFTDTGTLRQYAIASAPLSRAQFRVGDRIRVARDELFQLREVRALFSSFTFFGAVLHVLPIACPFFAPLKWALTTLTYLGRKAIFTLGPHGASVTARVHKAHPESHR